MKLTILETSDIHAHLSNKSFTNPDLYENFSLSKVKTYIDKVRLENDHVIYIDNGDSIQGSPLATFYHDNNDLKKLSKCI